MSDPAAAQDSLLEGRDRVLRNGSPGDVPHNLGFATAAEAWAEVDRLDVRAIDQADPEGDVV